MYLTKRKKGALKGKDNLILFFSLLVWTEFNYLSRVRLASQKIGALHLQIVALSKNIYIPPVRQTEKKDIHTCLSYLSSSFHTYSTCSRKKCYKAFPHLLLSVIITFLETYTKHPSSSPSRCKTTISNLIPL